MHSNIMGVANFKCSTGNREHGSLSLITPLENYTLKLREYFYYIVCCDWGLYDQISAYIFYLLQISMLKKIEFK